jgi:putative ABC transport system permease protein
VRAAAQLARAGLLRAPGRTALRAVVLAGAVALLGSMLLFVGHSLRTMTAGATRAVPLDWQGPVTSYAGARRVAAAVGREPGIEQASPAATAPFAGIVHRSGGSTTSAGRGAVFAVPGDYGRHLHTFRLLQGSLRPGGIVLDQQLAATLQAHVGDVVAVTPRPGTAPRRFPVSGVALMTAPDPVFQPLNPQLGPAPAQPPADVALMPLGTFARSLAPALRAITPASVGSSAVPGAQDGIQWQVQAQLNPAALGGSPAQALKRTQQIAHRVERRLPGQVQFVDNLSDALDTAASDALYAQTLFIMLALPGALVALGLAYLAALGTVDRDRAELALLRARGAGRRELAAWVATESLALGLAGGVLGALTSFGATSLLVDGSLGLTLPRALAVAATCLGLAVGGAAAARLATSRTVWQLGVASARRGPGRGPAPLWQRLHLDFLALAVSGLLYWLTARTGFSAVINPDSNPTLSLSVYMFFAPALLWVGATALLVRLRGRALTGAIRRARASLGGRASTLSDFLLASAGRRGPALNRGLVVVGLLLAFGVNLGIFTATYDQQAHVDAQLTLGGDVTATAPPGVVLAHHLPTRIGAVPGVRSTTAVDHSYAYVGPDLQDTYGIDATTLPRATTLRDSYFLGASARDTMARLRARPDAILVSTETITDYQLHRGDLLELRVLDHRSGRFHIVPFHVAGIVQEFPSAPRDSFMVANLAYLRAADHAGGPNTIFIGTRGDPRQVARRVAAATRADGTSVKDIRQQTEQTASSITTVDLSGISRIERTFTWVLAAAAMVLFAGLAVAERRRELATMAAVGAPLREVAAFLWSEVALVLAGSLALAAGLGWLLAQMLVAMLRHVFDPPPDHLAIPWGFLGTLDAAALGGAAVACIVATLALRRLPLGAILREQ